MASRLPGFLRRSLRISYDDDESDDNDEDNDDEAEDKPRDGSNHPPGRGESSGSAHSQALRTRDAEGQGADSPGVPPPSASTSLDGSRGVAVPILGAPPTKETIPRDPPPSADSDAPVTGASLVDNRSDGNSDADGNAALHDSWQQALASASRPGAASSSSSSSATVAVASSSDDPSSSPAPAAAAPRSWREIQMQKCLDADVVSLVELRKLAWNGIPNSRDRALAWKLLLGYAPTNRSRRDSALARKRSEYKNTVAAQHFHASDDTRTAQDQETLRQVLVDVPRTAPDIPLFRHDRIKRMLSRLLYSWAMRHPASSYVQGINDLATPLIVVFLGSYFDGDDVLDGHVMNHLDDDKADELEADVYWCLTNLLSGIQDHYTADQPGVQRMVKRLEELANRIDHALCQHLRNEGVEFLQFSFKWMNCLLLREFHLRCVPRLWDTYLAEKSGFEDFHVYVCAAFLCQFSSDLQTMPFDRLFGFFQEMPTGTWTDTEVEMLLSQAYVLSTLFGGSDAHLANTGAP